MFIFGEPIPQINGVERNSVRGSEFCERLTGGFTRELPGGLTPSFCGIKLYPLDENVCAKNLALKVMPFQRRKTASRQKPKTFGGTKAQKPDA